MIAVQPSHQILPSDSLSSKMFGTDVNLGAACPSYLRVSNQRAGSDDRLGQMLHHLNQTTAQTLFHCGCRRVKKKKKSVVALIDGSLSWFQTHSDSNLTADCQRLAAEQWHFALTLYNNTK